MCLRWVLDALTRLRYEPVASRTRGPELSASALILQLVGIPLSTPVEELEEG